MAVLRHALGGGASGSLPMEAVDLGIRATDMELLDRPTLGLRL